jgi:hypothetical protein
VSRSVIRRTRKGDFEVRLGDDERDVIGNVVRQLREALAGDASADPGFRRLFPVAYADDAAKEAQYRELVGDELVQKRLASIDVVLSSLASSRLTEDELMAWIGAVNDLRLVLGTRLDVSEETDLRVDPSDPDAGAYALYGWLGYLLETCVDAISS